MRRALLLFNPLSGRRTTARRQTIALIAEALHANGVDAQTAATHGAGTAGSQVADACAEGFDTVFACGGDGTVHEILQGIAHQPQTTLGIIPLGTANALARHLRLPLDPVQAALRQLDFTAMSVPLGKVTFHTPAGIGSRYFAVMAGAGPDGALVYRMLAAGKHRLGRSMYYLRSASLFCRNRFSTFPFTAGLGPDASTMQQAISVMAVRVDDLGGLFSALTRGDSIEDPFLSLTVLKPPAGLALPLWFATSWAQIPKRNPYLLRLNGESFYCGAGINDAVHVQADGEWLGRTPMTLSLVPNALRLLMPRQT